MLFADDTSMICNLKSNENISQKIENILEQTDK